MSDQPRSDASDVPAREVGEDEIQLVSGGPEDEERSTVSEPGKILRIGTMLRALQQELREEAVDEASRERLRRIHQTATDHISGALSGALKEELAAFTLPFDDEEPPTEGELRVAHAQLIGWLEGMFQGIQMAMMAQGVRPQALPGGRGPQGQRPDGAPADPTRGTGQYL